MYQGCRRNMVGCLLLRQRIKSCSFSIYVECKYIYLCESRLVVTIFFRQYITLQSAYKLELLDFFHRKSGSLGGSLKYGVYLDKACQDFWINFALRLLTSILYTASCEGLTIKNSHFANSSGRNSFVGLLYDAVQTRVSMWQRPVLHQQFWEICNLKLLLQFYKCFRRELPFLRQYPLIFHNNQLN